jgi:hypothetical protein
MIADFTEPARPLTAQEAARALGRSVKTLYRRRIEFWREGRERRYEPHVIQAYKLERTRRFTSKPGAQPVALPESPSETRRRLLGATYEPLT